MFKWSTLIAFSYRTYSPYTWLTRRHKIKRRGTAPREDHKNLASLVLVEDSYKTMCFKVMSAIFRDTMPDSVVSIVPFCSTLSFKFDMTKVSMRCRHKTKDNHKHRSSKYYKKVCYIKLESIRYKQPDEFTTSISDPRVNYSHSVPTTRIPI